MKTIGDMQYEMDFYDHYKMFVYNQEYVKLMKYSYIYKTRIHTFIKQSLTDLENYMSNYTWLYVHLYE